MAKRKAQCWIFSYDEDDAIICLLLRTNRKRGSFWQPVTGSAEAGERFVDAALREAQEETGIEFDEKPIAADYAFHFLSRFGKKVEERVFALVIEEPLEPELDPSEHDDYAWVDLADALELCEFESNIEGLKRAFKAVFGKKLKV